MISVIFYTFAALAIASAGYIIFTKNILHAALSLVVTLLCIAIIYVFSNAEFVAVTQIMIYVGGIVVLIVFGVMLTNDFSDKHQNGSSVNLVSGSVITLSLASLLIYGSIKLPNDPVQYNYVIPVELLGKQLMTTYLLPFEMAALLLLLSLIAASVIAGSNLNIRQK